MNFWSIARYDLGLSEQEFWRMTGRQLAALIARREDELSRWRWLVALLASVTANFSMARPKEPLTPEDFMPQKKKPDRTEQEIAEDFAQRFALIAVTGAIGSRFIN